MNLRVVYTKLKNKLRKNHIKDFKNVKHYFKEKYGLEIGGPSVAFGKNRYMPIYQIMKNLDFDLPVLKRICEYFGLKIITEAEKHSDHIIIAEK